MDLPEFIRSLAREPFVWGENDCALTIANWWRECHGEDPAAHLRGTYSTQEECHRVLRREGGLLRIVSRIAVSVGAPRTIAPQPGDVAVIRHGAIHFGVILSPSRRWVGKDVHGVAAIAADQIAPVAMWSVR